MELKSDLTCGRDAKSDTCWAAKLSYSSTIRSSASVGVRVPPR